MFFAMDRKWYGKEVIRLTPDATNDHGCERRNSPAKVSNAPWPPLIKMDDEVRKRIDALLKGNR
jgi:hypothetical protein